MFLIMTDQVEYLGICDGVGLDVEGGFHKVLSTMVLIVLKLEEERWM